MSARTPRRPPPTGPTDLMTSATSTAAFGDFLAAVSSAGLEHLLLQRGPFTVFAPTDHAFGKLTDAEHADLCAPERRAQLTRTVSNHFVQGRHGTADFGRWRSVRMISGRQAAISRAGSRLSLDGARVTIADIGASNGVLHASTRYRATSIHHPISCH